MQYLLEENNINDNKIASLLINDSNDLLNLEEIEEYKEFFMRKEYLDSSFTNSKTSKNRNRRKNKFSSRSSLKKVELNKNSDSDKNVLIKLKDTYYENKSNYSNKRQRKSCNTIIMRKLSGLNKTSGFLQFKESKKKTVIIGKKSDDDIKGRGIPHKDLFNIKNKNVINDINNIKIDNIKKDSDSFLRGSGNLNQFELSKIKRESRNKNNIADIAKLKFNLTDTKAK